MRFVLAAVAALAAVLTQHSATATPRPQTLWSRAHTQIVAFAQDGPYIAWFSPAVRGCNTVSLRSLSSGVQIQLPKQSARNVTCRFVRAASEPVGLALAGTRALWTLPQKTPLPLDYLLGAAVGDTVERRFQEVAHTPRGIGQWLGGVAGRGATLTYAVTAVDYEDEAACLAGTGKCTLVKSGGGVYRVHGRVPVHVPDTEPAVEVATSGSAIAYVPTSGIAKDGRPRAGADLPVTIVDANTGEQFAAVVPQGVPIAIALSAHVLATLEQTPLGLRLAWYRSTTGQPLGSVPVPETTAPLLAANDRVIVFRVGRSIRAVDVPTHRVHALVRAAAVPVGLSLSGGWLRWAENIGSSARIRALYVSGKG
jgi:hypothetical protein